MNNIIREFLEGKQKTNLHALLCLKKIYYDDQRSIISSFQQREVSAMWQSISQLNPTFLNSGVAPVYMTKQKFISKVGQDLYILDNYRASFLEIDWADIVQKIESIQPLFAPIYHNITNDRANFINYVIETLREPPPEIEIRLIPALLEIFSYSVLKTHLKYFGSDIFRWTRTNSNDGGVDMTCGDVSYSITTNLDLKKMHSDVTKQVTNRLNFITIHNRLSVEKIQEIQQEAGISINVFELSNLVQLINSFTNDQKEILLETLHSEILKEL